MKKILFSILIGLLAYRFIGLLFPSPVQANCQMLDVSFKEFLACVDNGNAPEGTTVSWLYRLSSAEYQEMQQIIDWNNDNGGKYNFDVRLYVPGALPTNNQVDAFLASLTSLNSATEINARLVNEPNNLGNENLVPPNASDEVVLATAREVALRVYEIYERAYTTLNQLEVTDRISLGLTLDHVAPYWLEMGTVDAKTFLELMNNTTGLNVMDKFYEWDVIWMVNAYVYLNNPTQIGQYYNLNTLHQDLQEKLGVPLDMRIAIFEIGALREGEGVVYDTQTLVALFTNQNFIQALKDSEIEWFTIFIRSPEPDEPGYYFLNLPRSVLEAFANFYSGKDPFSIGTLTEAEFQQLLDLIQALIEAGLIVACPEGGFAASLEECEEGVAPGFPIYPSLFESLACDYQALSDRDSRPNDCDPCNMTNNFCPSCATSFTIGTTVDWQWRNKNCEDDGTIWWKADWGGIVTIDPTQTKIPFVGKKGNEDEKLYLADYFDGTNEYYEVANQYNQYWLDWINHAGVLRKLAPMEYQDELKKDMVERAVNATSQLSEGNIHNYELKYNGRICWDLPFLTETFVLFLRNFNVGGLGPAFDYITARTHYCVFSKNVPLGLDLRAFQVAVESFNAVIDALPLPSALKSPLKIAYRLSFDETDRLASLDGNFPPKPGEEDYLNKWQAWKNSEWGRLWEVVPMTSREDTPGWISPYYNYRRFDDPQFIEPQVEKVPHVARLYESTQEVQNILLPLTKGESISQNRTEPIIASAELPQSIITSSTEKEVLGEEILLAQACGNVCPIDLQLYVPPAAPGVYSFPSSYCIPCDCGGIGDLHNLRISDSGGSGGYTPMLGGLEIQCPSNIDTSWGTGYSASLVRMDVGSSFTVSVSYEKAQSRKERCCTDGGSGSCTITLMQNEQGEYYWDITCGEMGPAPPANACATPEGLPVNQCELTAITDSNPNDGLCCEEINLDMSFVDAFIDHNPEYTYTECSPECDCCSPPKPDGCHNPCVCDDDPCLTPVYKEVTRDWGINLSHPYLTPIWEQTAKSESGGIFNIFRPAQIPEFEELDAHSTINYGFTGGDISSSEGKFYFNYLGGVQRAKEWVATKVLMPYIEQ